MNIFDPHITGSMSVSASAQIEGDLTVLGTIYGSAQISGQVDSAISASHAAQYLLTSSFEAYTGSLATTGSNTFIGDQTISGSLLPQGTLTHDLGSDGQRWRDIYLAGNTINLGGTKITKNDSGNVEIKDSSDNLKKIVASEIELGTGASKKVLRVSNGKLKLTDDANSKEEEAQLSGSFTGSFVGDGSRIVNVPASAVQGLSLNRISDGAVTASIGNGKMTLNANFEPDLTDTRDLGSPTKQWRDLFLSSGSLYINGQQVISTTGNELRITTDEGESIKIIETASDTITLQTENGDITLTSSGNGNIELDAPIQIGAGKKILSSDGNSISFANGLVITGSIVLSGDVDGVDVARLKSDVDAILLGSSADKDSFAEIVGLINSVDTANDQAFAAYYTASNNRFASIESTTASFDGRLDSLEVKTGSIQSDITKLYSSASIAASSNASGNDRLNSIELVTASFDGRLDSIETETGSLSTRIGLLEDESGSIRTTFNSYTSSNNTTNTTQNNRLTSIESFTSSIDDTYATDEDVNRFRGDFNTYTSSNNTTNTNQNNRLTSIETTTSSFDGRLDSLETKSGSVDITLGNFGGELSSLDGRLDSIETFTGSLDATFATDADVTSLRGTLNTYTSSNNNRLNALETKSGSVDTLNNTQNNRLNALEIATGSIITVNNTQNGRLNSIESATSSLDGRLDIIEGGLEFTGSNVTVKGDLLVKGSTVSINSTEIDLGDNIISLNGTGAVNGGIKVNDGPASGSLLWDGAKDYWVAGRENAEERIITDGLFHTYTSSLNNTNSIQNSRLSSLETTTGSIISVNNTQNGRLDSLESFTGSLDETYATDEDVTRLRGDFNSHTSSNNTTNTTQNNRLTSIETATGSIIGVNNDQNVRLTALEITTGSIINLNNSQNGRLDAIEARTGSYLTEHPNINSANSSNNSGRTYIQDVLLDGNGHVTGLTTATETVVNTDRYVTGATFNNSTADLTLTRNDGNAVTVRLLDTLSDVTVTGGTYNSGTQTLVLTKSDGNTVSVSGFAIDTDVNWYTTGATFNTGNGVITLTRNDGSTISVDIDGKYAEAGHNHDSVYVNVGGDTMTGDLSLGDNQLKFGNGNVSAPSSTNQDAGTRINLFPQSNHYSIGVESGNMWFNSDGGYKWYNDSNNIASLSLSGVLYVNGGNSGQWNTAYGWGNHATRGYLTEHPSVSAATSSNNSGRTYIQDILLDSFGHITGITTATETVTDTNNYVNAVSWNSSNGIITIGREGLNSLTLDIDGRYLPFAGGTLTGTIDVHVGDTGTILSSGNASATGTPDQFFIKHTNGGVEIGNLRGDINFTNGNLKNDGNLVWDAGDFTSTNISNWNTAYGWGDHASAGYLTAYSETDTLATVTSRGSSTTSTIDVTAGNILRGFNASGGSTVFHQLETYWNTNAASSTATLRFDVGLWRLWSGIYGGYVLNVRSNGNVEVVNNVTASSFIKTGGTSTQFLKADGSVDANTYLTAHPSVSAASSSNNSGRTYIQDILLDSFGHITGLTTATETVVNTDRYVTGATFNNSTADLTLTRNDGNTVTVRLLDTLSDVTVTGGTYNSSNQTLTLTKSDGSTVNVNGFAVDTDVNWYTTGATFNTGNGVITGTRNDGGTWTVDIDGRYLTSESDTLATVTSRGSSTSTALTLNGALTLNNTLTMTSTSTQPFFLRGDSAGSNGLFRIQIDDVNDSFGTGARTFLGDGGIDVFIGTSNGSYTPNNTYIALNHSGEISMGAGSATKHLTLSTSGNLSVTGTLSASGYNKSNWDTAYGWGNHASVGYALSNHKYHTFSNGDEYYDSYGQNNNLRLFTENATFDNFRFRSYSNVEYFDGANWVPWGQSLDTLFDGREETGFSLGHANSHFRFEINRSSGWPTTALFVIQSSWSDTNSHTCEVTLETWNGSAWVQKDNWTYSNFQRGINLHTTSQTHDGIAQMRVTINMDWTDASHNYYPLRRILFLSNFSGGATDMQPFTWEYNKNVTFSNQIYVSGGNSSQWNTAYSWGNHASAGYLTSYTDTNHYTTGATFNSGNGVITFTRNNGNTYTVDIDGKYLDLTGGSVEGTLNLRWPTTSTTSYELYFYNQNYHAKIYSTGGDLILTSGTGEKFRTTTAGVTVSGVVTATGGNSSNWNTAYGWGDHSTRGYLTSVPSPQSGDWWNDGFARVGTDGVMEIGKYIDFHDSDTTTSDYNFRITNSGDRLYFSGDIELDGGDIYINDSNTRLTEGTGNALRIQTNTGYVDLGSMNTNWVHFQADRSVYMWANGGLFSFDADVIPHSNNTKNLGSSANRWATIYANGGDSTQWNTAYGWGNHASAGYLTSLPSHTHAASSITQGTFTAGRYTIPYQNGVTGSTAPNYSNGGLELYTDSNHVPTLSFHRGGISATALYEYDGQLYVKPWTTRAQIGLLLSSGNISAYADPVGAASTVNDRIDNEVIPSIPTNNNQLSNGAGYITSTASISGNAATASKWATARTITLSGDLNGSVSIDGSANVTLSAQVVNDSHTHDDRYFTETESDARYPLSRGGLGTSTTVGDTTGWGNNLAAGTYTRAYVGHGGQVIMSHDTGGSVGNVGIEVTYYGAMYVHTNVDSNQWLTKQIWTSENFTSTNISNWNTAYGWGNHASAGYTTTDYYTTGATFNSGTGIITFTRNNGATYTLNIAATLTDVTVTGGTYNSSNQTLTLTKSNGTTVSVSGFAIDTDVNWYTTSASFNTGNGVITGTRNDGGTWTVDIDGRFVPYSGGNMTGNLNWGTTGTGLTWTMNTDGAYIIFYNTGDGDTDSRLEYGTSDNGNEYHRWMVSSIEEMTLKNDGLRVTNDIYMAGNIVATQAWVSSRGYLTSYTDTNYYTTGATFNTGNGVITGTLNNGSTWTVDIDGRYLTTHPTIAGASSNNSGRTYIQDVLTDANGHVTGLTTATETVVNTDTNYYTTGATFNTSNGIITGTRNDGGTWTVDIDGRFLTGESDTLATVTARGASTSTAVTMSGGATITGLTVAKSGTDSLITFPAQTNDPGFIKHYESSNTARMYFSVSDDSGTTDYFGFGYSSDQTRFIIYSDGSVYGKGTAEFDGTIYADSGLRVRGDWVRVSGSNGLYFEDYGGGWRMTGTAYVEMYGSKSLHMQNGSIDYVGQLHFNDNVRFYDEGNDQYLNYKWGNGGAGGIKFVDGDNSLQGYVYGSGTGSFGFLDSAGNWKVRVSTSEVEMYGNQYLTNVYANVFYDRDNSAYYLNPNQASNLATLTLNSPTSGTTVFNIQGTQGQLFSITDDLTGDLFSVSDASGVPIFNVNANSNVDIDGRLIISKNNTSTVTSTAHLILENSATSSGQNMIVFRNGGTDNGLIRSDSSGNFIVNSLNGTFYYNNDFGGNSLTFTNVSTTFMTVSSGTVSFPNTVSANISGNAASATNLGADYTADDWFRATGDNNPVKFYGNSYQMTFRTDGVSEAYSGIGGYPFVWTYGGSGGTNRRMLLDTSGNLWTNTYGWLHDYFQASSTAINTGNIGSQSVNYATSAGSATTAGYATTAGSADQIDGIGFRNTASNAAINADSLDSNGITYYTGGVTNFSGNATDGALYSQAYSSSWQHQIAGDYRSGQIAVRGKNNGTWQSWKKVALVNTVTFTNVTSVSFTHGLGTDNIVAQVYDGGGSLFFPSELRSAGGIVTVVFEVPRSGRLVVTG